MNLKDHLEPIASAAGEADPTLSAADTATLSIAVSLKRIADAMEQPTITNEMSTTMSADDFHQLLEERGDQLRGWMNREIRNGGFRGY